MRHPAVTPAKYQMAVKMLWIAIFQLQNNDQSSLMSNVHRNIIGNN